MITFEDDKYLSLDGYNQYLYIMEGDSIDSDNLNKRDHVLFHIVPTLDDETNNFVKPIDLYKFCDIEEIAIVFYDKDGNLWKFLNHEESTNYLGDPTINSGWCIATDIDHDIDSDEYSNSETKSNDTFSVIPCVCSKGESTYGLYQISTDGSEINNYLENENENDNGSSRTKIEDSNDDKILELKKIIDDKINFYVSKSRNKDYLFGSFDCFLVYDDHLNESLIAAKNSNAWVPFLDTNDILAEEIREFCNLNKTHPIYRLLTTGFKMPQTLIIDDLSINNANREEIKKLNNLVPKGNININNNNGNEIIIDLTKTNNYNVGGYSNSVNSSKYIKYKLIVIAIFALSIIVCLMYTCITSNVALKNKMIGYDPL